MSLKKQSNGVWEPKLPLLAKELSMLAIETWPLAVALTITWASRTVMAQETIEEVRNNYNFLQAGLSTLAAGSSVALCLARRRLDAEMGIADFFTMTRLEKQNKYNSYKAIGNNGEIIGVHVAGEGNLNTTMWTRHNAWAQGSSVALVCFHIGPPPNSGAAAPDPNSTPCTCWHIPSIAAYGGSRGAAALYDVAKCANDPQLYRVPSYQCEVHGKENMPDLHSLVMKRLAESPQAPLATVLDGPSKLYQWMIEDKGMPYTYFFGVDKIGARSLTRMVSESMVTMDASEKGRTSDLVDWSLGRLELSEKPDIKWRGNWATVVLVSLLELVLVFLLAVVFGLDPFVSSLGARRGVRSLRLGAGGVTSFAEIWLLEAKGYTVEGWSTPVLRLQPREGLSMWYVDVATKIIGLVGAWSFWICSVVGVVHPLGLDKNQAWQNDATWTVCVGCVGSLVGLVTCLYARGLLDRLLPVLRREKGFMLLHWSILECLAEVAFSVLRLTWPHTRPFMMDISRGSLVGTWMRRWWYVLMEVGIWMQWLTSKRALSAGPHSDSQGVAWQRTFLLAGALTRATCLAAVSGNWK